MLAQLNDNGNEKRKQNCHEMSSKRNFFGIKKFLPFFVFVVLHGCVNILPIQRHPYIFFINPN